MKNIVVIGAGPAGLLYACRLADMGFNVTVCEKRSEDELEKLQNILYLKKNTIDALPEEAIDYLFSGDSPKTAYSAPNPGLTDGSEEQRLFATLDYHCIVKIADLIKALIEASIKRGISIQRGWHYQESTVSPHGVKCAHFIITDNEHHLPYDQEYDQLIFAGGLSGTIELSKDKSNGVLPPQVLHHAQSISARFTMPYEKYPQPSCAIVPPWLGEYGALFAGDKMLTVFKFMSPEEAAQISATTDPLAIKRLCLKFIRDYALSFKERAPHLLEGMPEETENVAIITATASVCPTILNREKAFWVVGDASLTTYYAWGAEFNSWVTKVMPLFFEAMTEIQQGITFDIAADTYEQKMIAFINANPQLSMSAASVGQQGSKTLDGRILDSDYRAPSFEEILKQALDAQDSDMLLVAKDDFGFSKRGGGNFVTGFELHKNKEKTERQNDNVAAVVSECEPAKENYAKPATI